MQTALFAVVVLAVALCAFIPWLQSRSARAKSVEDE